MLGGKNRQPLGYTIVEVMIVLAVSGLMFVIAANFINGKQQKSAFIQGVNEMASRLQGVIEQVTNGQYSDIPLDCRYEGGTTAVSSGSNHQGTNPTCVFLGKIVHLAENNGNSSDYEIFSIAGGRVDSTSDSLLTALEQADPQVIPDLTVQQTIPQQLRIRRITINGSLSFYGIGFLQSSGSFDDSGTLQSGAQTISMYYISTLGSGVHSDYAISRINMANAANFKPAQSVDICVTDSAQYADITLGDITGTSSQLSVNVIMHGTTRPPTC